MRIKLQTIAAGKINGRAGDVLDLPDEQAKDLIGGGFATLADDDEDVDQPAKAKPPKKEPAKKDPPKEETTKGGIANVKKSGKKSGKK